MITHKEILKNELLNPYNEKYKFYSKWSSIHKIGYWIFVFIQLGLGFGLTLSLILKKESEYIVFFAIALNFALVISQYLQLGRKYKRNRLTEIKIEFLLLKFCNSFYKSNSKIDINEYIKTNISELGGEIEKIISDEFSEHFVELKKLNEFSEQSKIIEAADGK